MDQLSRAYQSPFEAPSSKRQRTATSIRPTPMEEDSTTVDDLRAMGNSMQVDRMRDAFDMSKPCATDIPRSMQPGMSEEDALVPEPVRSALVSNGLCVDSVDAQREHTPLITKLFLFAQLREPDTSAGERACSRGQTCMARGINSNEGFILHEYQPLNPDGTCTQRGTTPALCMYCLVNLTLAPVLQLKLSGGKLDKDIRFPFRVAVDTPGEFTLSEVILSGRKKYNGPLFPFPWLPHSGYDVRRLTPHGPRTLVLSARHADGGRLF
jgi:hypothetical protein